MNEQLRLYERLPATEDVAWWRDRAASAPGGRVLYVGSGTGRLAIPIAEVSTELVAVDRDPDMLSAFAARIQGTPLAARIELVRAEAAELDLPGSFGLVVLPSSLLNGIHDPAERTAAARAAAGLCRPDGHVVLQVLNPYWMACDDPSARGRITGADGGEPVDVAIRMVGFDAWEQRQQARITYRFADGEELVDEIDAIALYPRELRALAFQAGLDVVERWGALPGQDELGVSGGSWHLVCRPRGA